MSERSTGGSCPDTDAAIEISLSRVDLLTLSDGRSFDVDEVVETSDGTVVDLTVTLTKETAD